MTTGDRIKQARKAAGLTQTELAQKIGVKFSTIHKYESGMIVNLKRETIAALAEVLDVRPSWLMCIDELSSDTQEKTNEELKALAEEKALHDEINALFDQMPPELRTHALAVLKGLARSQSAPDDRGGSD